MYSASPCFTLPLPGGNPWPSGRMSMPQPAISSAVAARPMPSCLASAAGCVAGALPAGRRASCARPLLIATRLAAATSSNASRHFDILHLAAPAHVPGLDAVVVIDGIHPTDLAQSALGRLDVAGLVDGARLQQQLAAVPVDLVVEPRQRLVPNRAVEFRRAPVAAAIERNVHARNFSPARPREPRRSEEHT